MTGFHQRTLDPDFRRTKPLEDDHWLELAHHIRTPLNAAKGAAYHLQNARNLSGEEICEFINLLAREIDRLALVLEEELSSRRKS
jgi:nitrogen-specific signal transduction histidine kinase